MRAPIVLTSLLIGALTTVSASPFPPQRFRDSSKENAADFPASVTGSQTVPEVHKRQNAEDVLCSWLALSAPSLACTSSTSGSLPSYTTTALSPSVSLNSSQPVMSGSPITSFSSYRPTITSCNPTPTCKSLPNSEIACGANMNNPDAVYCTCNNGCSYTATVTGAEVNNGICAWSGTPTGPPMTVDCTSIPQTAIPGLNKCPYDQWNLTAENWQDANVDGELSSFFFNEVTDAPTYIKGTYPTKLPAINTGPSEGDGFGIGYIGKLISAASGGQETDCSSIIGGNMAGCNPPGSVDDACGNVPRWAYLAWAGLWNMVYINAQIYSILESMDTDDFAQASELETAFSVPYSASSQVVTEIMLSVIGAMGVIIGVLMPLEAVGSATVASISKADAETVVKHGSGGAAEALGVPRSPSQPNVEAPAPVSGDSTDSQPPPGDSPTTPNAGDAGDTGSDAVVITTGAGTGVFGKIYNSQFLGNALFIAPATLTNLGNTIWADIRPQQDALQLVQTIQTNIIGYFSGQKNITQANNQYLTQSSTDPAVATALLLNSNIQALGAFVNPQWSPVIYENLVSADVMAREINGNWRTAGAKTYVSYTFLDDDVNATKCFGPASAATGTALAGDTNGSPSTKYCADGGVYYLNRLDTNKNGGQAVLSAPYGFDSLLSFGIFPWYPASGSAKAYRALNPDSSKTPVYDTPAAEAAYNDYIIEQSTKFPADLINLIGQNPGTWSLPVCDQGYNTWTYDWSNSGGLVSPSPVQFNAFPCACGYQGTGTANFYTALGVTSSDLATIAASCREMLLNVAPGLPLTEQNIGWNAIIGGAPKSIVYGPSDTITAPTSIPTTLCYSDGSFTFNKPDCQNSPPPSGQSKLDN